VDSEGVIPAAPSARNGKQYKTGEATKFDLIGPGIATISQGVAGSMTVTATPDDDDHLEVKLDGDTLTVVFHGGLVRKRGPQGPIRYGLTVPVLEELSLSGGLAVEANNIEGREVKVDLKDGSSLSLAQFRAAHFEARLEAGSRLTASGTAAQQKIKLAAKSSYQGGAFDSEEAEVEAAGSSEAIVRVSKKLKVKAEAGSIVSYSGQKVDLSVTTSAGSELRQVHS